MMHIMVVLEVRQWLEESIGVLLMFCLVLSECLIHRYIAFVKVHQAVHLFVHSSIVNTYFNEMLF